MEQLVYFITLIYINRNSMGNTQVNEQQQSPMNPFQNKKTKNSSSSIENTIRYSLNTTSMDRKSSIQFTKNHQQNNKHRSLNNKSKQKLSLSKQHHSQSQIKLKPSRTSSNDLQHYHLNRTINSTHTHYQSQTNISRPFVRFNTVPLQQKIKKVVLRPRDLPRKFSTQKVIILEQPQIRRVPLEPRIIITPPLSSPCIHINFATKTQKNKSQYSMQSSIVTPFVPATPEPIQQQPKRLKKVALNRSYVNSPNGLLQNNGQELQLVNKQNEKTALKKRGQIKSQSRIQIQSKQELLFTDPTLYSYITNKPHPCANHIRTKYALPVDESNAKPAKYTTLATPSKIIKKLEEAITEQVQSKPIIQSQSYRFPTFTDVSQGSHTDNTSFVPMIRNNSSKNQEMHGEQLLNYCRPRIDERVFADLQKLKLNT